MGDATEMERQLAFDVGPFGSYTNASTSRGTGYADGHGQLDLLNLELNGYKQPLIRDPGYQRDAPGGTADMEWTHNHNTISVISGSHHYAHGHYGPEIGVGRIESADRKPQMQSPLCITRSAFYRAVRLKAVKGQHYVGLAEGCARGVKY